MTDLRDIATEAKRKARQRRPKLKVVEGTVESGGLSEPPPSMPDGPAAFPGTGESVLESGAESSNTALAMAALNDAYRRAGLGEDDPLTPIVQALAQIAMANGAAADALPEKLDAVVKRAERAAREQLDASVAAAISERDATLRGVAGDLAPMVGQMVGRAVRRFDWMLMASVAGALALAVIGAGAGGYFYGRASMEHEARVTEAKLSAAFVGGVSAAGEWAQLIQANAGASPMSLCKDGKAQHGAAKDGQRWCAVPLWLDPPRQEPPK